MSAVGKEWLQYINRDTMRASIPALFGFALYKMKPPIDGAYEADHFGSVGSREEAEKWCNGDDTVEIIKIYTKEGISGSQN